MKYTIVTPLYRVHNLDRLWANLEQVFQGLDWQWLVVLDTTSPEAHLIEGFENPRVINRRYEGGDRWKSSIARNMATEIEDGWIVNLDDDCLLHENAGQILRWLSKDTPVAAWQTLDEHGGIKNFPGPGRLASADANAFAYQRRVMEIAGEWEVREDADMFYFARLRSLFPVAYFQVPGAHWNVNR